MSADDSGNESFPNIQAVSADGSMTRLLDSDPLSSGWTFEINESSISPADNGWLRSIQKSEDGYVLIYSSRAYRFEQSVTVSDTGNYVSVTAQFTNNSTDPLSITPVLLLDTVLGEATGLPFHLPDGSYVSGEMIFSGSRIPEWIKTEKNIESPSMVLFFDNQFATTPDSIALANWLRLKQQGGSFTPVGERDFNYLPFSEGDSAILLRYREKKLAPGDEVNIKLILGLNTRPPDRDSFVVRPIIDQETGIESRRLREYTIRRRIEEIRSVLDSLDYLLDNSESITSEAVLELERITATQEKLRTEYENL